MLFMMIVVIAVMIGSGYGPMEMTMMGHHNPAHTEASSSVQIHRGGAEHDNATTKAE